MKHTLINATVFADGKLHMPGDTVDLDKSELISMGELDTDGNPLGVPAVTVAEGSADHQAALDELTKERDDAREAAMPDDARERLIAVKGVSEALADTILAALKA